MGREVEIEVFRQGYIVKNLLCDDQNVKTNQIEIALISIIETLKPV